MAISVNYQKRKNKELFAALESHEQIKLSNTQNYIPLYNNFFALNDTNYNSINLNHKWSINKLAQPTKTKMRNNKDNHNKDNHNKDNNADGLVEENKNLFRCVVKDINSDKTKETNVFFKMAPLLNPFKYLAGKYNTNDDTLFNLPKFGSTENTHPSLLDVNNSAYIDGCFTFLTSILIHEHNFIHGVDYYGSFLALKNNFEVDVIDDIDYLTKIDFFNANKDKLFTVEDYSHLMVDCELGEKLKPIKIHNGSNGSNGLNGSNGSKLSVRSVNEDLFEDLFDNESTKNNLNNLNNLNNQLTFEKQDKLLTLEDLKDMSLEIVDVTSLQQQDDQTRSNNDCANCATDCNNNCNDKTLNASSFVQSDSSCSSRSSHTNSNDVVSDSDDDNDNYCEAHDDDDCEGNNCDNDDGSDDSKDGSTSGSGSGSGSYESLSTSSSDYENDKLYATINKFPVQVITMEYCENTFDNLIENEDLTNDEWMSSLMQIIMILVTYQQAFSFTHNDLHTNNVMYDTTEIKHIYYLYKNNYYKVPTFGRLFKIIDYGRSIYKFKNNVFCSDSYKAGGDASTQYNIEPFLNENKPRLEPNYSFDLCRLACSLFDFVVDDDVNLKELDKCAPHVRIICDWCMDDNNINILYKTNGAERYPGFKLYKMIARHAHKHVPKNQLDRKEFSKFLISKSNIKRNEIIINIDAIPCFAQA